MDTKDILSLVVVEKVDLVEGEELMDLAKKVMVAITQNKGKTKRSLGLLGIFKDHIVVRDFEDGKLFRMEMKRDDDGNVLLDGMDEVKQTFSPVKPRPSTKAEGGPLTVLTLDSLDVVLEGEELTEDSLEMIKAAAVDLLKAQWTAAFVNNLPDSSFLHVESGDKDDEGKTTPRSLRHFPVKDAAGKVDLSHLRNALARIPQSALPQPVKDKAIAAARKLWEEANPEAGKQEKREHLWRGIIS